MSVIRESDLPNLIYRGKVRDTHRLDDGLLLMVATDRLSAFDVVLPTSIPDKGAILCQMSQFWLDKTKHIINNHLVELAINSDRFSIPKEIARRAMVVHEAQRIDVECIVRGYITGSAWAEYRKHGTVGGHSLQSGLREGDKFPDPMFTPTTKADEGHDENMTIQEVQNLVGKEIADKLEDYSISIYNYAHDFALSKDIIIADTKMEFGLINGELSLIDELLTPDSSRFWDVNGYTPGKSQPNFDKQFVRDWLDQQGWDHEPPAPELPDDIVQKTQQRYFEAHSRLTDTIVK